MLEPQSGATAFEHNGHMYNCVIERYELPHVLACVFEAHYFRDGAPTTLEAIIAECAT